MTQKKDSMLHIRISSTDLEKLKNHTDVLGVSVSEFCLNSILTSMGENSELPVMDNVISRLNALEREVFNDQTKAA